MDKTLRTILWALVGLVLLSSFSAGWFFVAKERLHSDYVDLENLFKVSTDRLKREVASAVREKIDIEAKVQAIEEELRISESKNIDLGHKYMSLVEDKKELNKELAMVKKGKFFLEKKVKEMESDIFMAGLLREKASLQVELEKVKNAAAPKNMEIGTLKTEIAGLNMKISSLQRERELMAKELKDSMAVAEVLSRDLSKEKDRQDLNNQQLTNLKTENDTLKSRIAEMSTFSKDYNKLLAEKEELRFKVVTLERDLERNKSEFDRLKTVFNQKKKEWESQAVAYQAPQQVDLPPIVLQREGYAGTSATSYSSPPKIDHVKQSLAIEHKTEGRIVTVNGDHRFVVIDLGSLHGVKEKDKFRVYRNGELIGAVEVIQTRERISAADVKYEKGTLTVQVNDTVIKR